MNGTVDQGGVGAYSTGAGNASVYIAGNVTNTNGSRGGAGVWAKTNTGYTYVTQTSGNIHAGNGSVSGDGIYAASDGAGVKVKTAANTTIISYGDGIHAVGGNLSTGNVTVLAGGAITSFDGKGIYAGTAGSGRVYVSTGNAAVIHSYGDGVEAVSAGTGDVTVKTNAAITSYNYYGIVAKGAGGNVSVTTNNTIHSWYDGIYAKATGNASTGAVTVKANGAITSYDGRGIYAGTAGNGNVYVSTGNTTVIKSWEDGVQAFGAGTGSVTVKTNADITSLNGDGVRATSSGSGYVSITTHNNITALYGDGVHAYTNTGAINVQTNGSINAGNVATGGGFGIWAVANSGSGTVTVGAYGGNITSNKDGVHAAGKGNVYVTTGTANATTNIHSYSGDGIYARSSASGGYYNVTVTSHSNITAGNATAGGRGIYAGTTGYGTVSVGSYGNITSHGDGIQAIGRYDVYVTNGTGNASANIVSLTGNGITARDTYGGSCCAHAYGNVDVTSHGNITATGGGYGIVATTNTYGTVTVNSYGNVTSTNTGISAYGNGSVSVTTGPIGNSTSTIRSYTGDGISAKSGSGRPAGHYSVTVTSHSNIVAGNATIGGRGIYADTAGYGQVGVYSYGNVTSHGTGIQAQGKGNVYVTDGKAGVTTNIQSFTGDGISATSTDTGGDYYVTVTSHSNITAGNATAGGRGIYAGTAGYGTVRVYSYGNITSHGTGIQAQGKGNVYVTTGNGSVTNIHSYTGDGISAKSTHAGGYYNVTVTSNSNIVAGNATIGGHGIFARAYGNGTVSVTSLGNITSHLAGIYAKGNGDVSVTTGNGTLIHSYTGDGIYADSTYCCGINNGAVTVTSHSNIVAGNATGGGRGIAAFGHYGVVTVTSTGNITSYQSGIVAAHDVTVSVTTGNGTAIHSYTGDGIYASSVGCCAHYTVTVTSGSNIVAGNASIGGRGIYARTTELGNVAVSSYGNITSHATGIEAIGSGNVTVATTGLNIHSYTGDGIFARTGIGFDSYTVTVTSHSNIVAGNATIGGHGIYADTPGYGNVAVGSFGNVTSHLDGVFARGNGTVSVTTGNGTNIHSYTADGIFAQSTTLGAKTVTVTSGSNIVAGNATVGADGIHATTGGTGAVTVTSNGNVTAYFTGISATGYGAVSVTTGNGTTVHAYHADGIFAHSGNATGTGSVTVTSHSNVTSGNATLGAVGIYAGTAGNGVVTVGSYGAINSYLTGIYARSHGSGNVTANSTGNITAKHGNALFAYTTGSGNVTVNASGVMTSPYGVGGKINDAASAGNVNVTSAGSSTATGTNAWAVFGWTNGTGSVTVTNNGGAYSAHGAGVVAGTEKFGNVTLSNSGNVSAYNEGLLAYSFVGNVSITNSGHVHASGNYSTGILGAILPGTGSGIGPQVVAPVALTITNSAYSYGHKYGIQAIHHTFGTITVNNSGMAKSVYSSGPKYGAGIGVIHDGIGAIAVNNLAGGTAIGTGTFSDGIDVKSKYTGNPVTVTNAGVVTGSWAGVGVEDRGGAVVVLNHGSIAAKYSVWTYGNSGNVSVPLTAPTTVTNYAGAVMTGGVALSANSTVTNAGLWRMPNGSYFQYNGNTTVNTVTNSGTVQLVATSPKTITVSNVTVWNNSGLVDLRTGVAGNWLDLNGGGKSTPTVWNSTAGSKVGLDVNLTGNLSVHDTLEVGTVSATSVGGNATLIILTDTAPNAPASVTPMSKGNPFIIADGGAPAGCTVAIPGAANCAFVMNPFHKGFVDYILVDPAGIWTLAGVPAQNAFELLKVPSFGQDFWRRSADAWSSREQEVRDSLWGTAPATRAPGWEMWAQAFTGNQDDTRPLQTVKANFGGTPQTFDVNLGVNNQWNGFQMGGDQLTANNWLWGFTAGFVEQFSRFRGLVPFEGQGAPSVHDEVTLSGWNIGAYGGWTSNRLFINALVKGDFFNADANMLSAATPTMSGRRTFQGDTWGAKGEVGFRFGSPSLYFEPLADIDWTSTHLTGVTLASTNFTWSDATSSKGEIGARVGGQFGSIMPYLGLYAVDAWSGNNRMNVVYGSCPTMCESAEDTAPGSYAKTDFGFTIANWHGLEGYLKGEALFGNHVQGETGRLGVRWHW
jgi:hypothetical protein